jgi:hypothetical protein
VKLNDHIITMVIIVDMNRLVAFGVPLCCRMQSGKCLSNRRFVIRHFVDVMRSVAAELRKCYRHRGFPLEELNRGLRLKDLGRTQLFDESKASRTSGTAGSKVVEIYRGIHAPLAGRAARLNADGKHRRHHPDELTTTGSAAIVQRHADYYFRNTALQAEVRTDVVVNDLRIDDLVKPYHGLRRRERVVTILVECFHRLVSPRSYCGVACVRRQ